MSAILSASSRNNVNALKAIQSQMQVVQQRLSTGKRVNSPADNASAYFTSTALTSRAGQLNGLLESFSNAKSAVSAATKGLSSIESLVTSARSLAQQAADTQNVFAKVSGTTSALAANSQIATTGGSSTRLRNGDTVTVSDGTTTATYTAANNDTAQTFLNAINNTANLKVTASIANGQLQLQGTSNVNITIGGTTGGTGTISGVLGLTAGTTSYVNNTAKQSLATQFDALRTQIDQLAKDASYNGTNLLAGGTLAVKLNETGTSQLTLSGGDATSAGIGLTASTGGFQSEADTSAALSSITNALSALKSQATILGSQEGIMNVREDFTKSLMETLSAGADSLVATDINEDSALLLALQTRQQVAATSLSLTQSSETAVLRLFGL